MNPILSGSLAQPSDSTAKKRIAEVQEQLRKLERRDWWLWSLAVIVMLLLTFTVFSMSFPELASIDDQLSLNQTVRALIGLVLLFNAYTIYQQVGVKRLRRQFSKQLEEMRMLQVRAEEFHRLAIVDPLTGLYNRRVAEERLAAEASRSRRYGHPLTVVSLDLDKFKQINDTYGHLAGDRVLKEFASRLNSVIRISDLASRMGGDEFLVVLPECSTDQVDALLARLRPLDVDWAGRKIAVSFSAGRVGYERGETTEQFLERADRTLYANKRAGRTRVEHPSPVA
jgi:diguanylate cyclase (GGDEF)-like protein